MRESSAVLSWQSKRATNTYVWLLTRFYGSSGARRCRPEPHALGVPNPLPIRQAYVAESLRTLETHHLLTLVLRWTRLGVDFQRRSVVRSAKACRSYPSYR